MGGSGNHDHGCGFKGAAATGGRRNDGRVIEPERRQALTRLLRVTKLRIGTEGKDKIDADSMHLQVS